MGMYDVLTGQGVAPANTYSVQGQLYSKLGGNLGTYSGTAAQNTWLEGALGGRNYSQVLNGGSPAPSQSSPAPASPPAATPNAPTTPAYSSYGQAADAVAKDLSGQYSDLYKPVTAADQALQQAQQAVINYYKNLTPLTDRYNQLYSQYGMDAAQNQSNTAASQLADSQNKLDALRGDVMQSTSPFLMSMADRDLYYNGQRQPLDQAIAAESRAQEVADKALSGKWDQLKYMLGLQTQQDQEGAKPYELGATYAGTNDTNARDTYNTLSKQAYQTASDRLSGINNDIKTYNDYNTSLRDQAFQKEMEQSKEAAAQAQAAIDETNKQNDLKLEYQLKNEYDTKAAQKSAQDTWNALAADPHFNSTYDIWNYVKNNWNQIAATGVDPQKLIDINNGYVQKYGQDAPVRQGAIAGARYKK